MTLPPDHRRQTSTITSNYNPDWNEVFTFMVPEGSQEPIKVSVFDWDRVGKHDFIGQTSVSTSASQVAETEQEMPMDRGAETRSAAEGGGEDASSALGDMYTLVDEKGMPVVGHDCRMAEVLLSVKVGKVEAAVDFHVHVLKGTNMPKADAFGTCDPYIMVEFGARRDTTSVQKGTYHPVWDQTYAYSVMEAAVGDEDLVFTLMDSDTMTRDDVLGVARINSDQVSEALLSPPG
jgi:Ca2+-dependent lipid-binding protein